MKIKVGIGTGIQFIQSIEQKINIRITLFLYIDSLNLIHFITQCTCECLTGENLNKWKHNNAIVRGNLRTIWKMERYNDAVTDSFVIVFFK